MVKGSVLDLFYVIAILFGLGIALFIGAMLQSKWDEATDFTGTAQSIIEESGKAVGVFDKILFGLFLGSAISTFVLAFQIRTHPIFFFFSLFLLVMSILVSAQVSNAFDRFINATQMTGYKSKFPITIHIFEKFPLYILLIGVLIILALYAKFKGGME